MTTRSTATINQTCPKRRSDERIGRLPIDAFLSLHGFFMKKRKAPSSYSFDFRLSYQIHYFLNRSYGLLVPSEKLYHGHIVVFNFKTSKDAAHPPTFDVGPTQFLHRKMLPRWTRPGGTSPNYKLRTFIQTNHWRQPC